MGVMKQLEALFLLGTDLHVFFVVFVLLLPSSDPCHPEAETFLTSRDRPTRRTIIHHRPKRRKSGKESHPPMTNPTRSTLLVEGRGETIVTPGKRRCGKK